MGLGVQYKFATATSTEAGFSAFILPQPLNLPMTLTARWLTDVIGLRPSCTWASTNITQPVMIPNQTDSISAQVGVYLKDMDLDVVVYVADVATLRQALATVTVKSPSLPSVINHTTLNPPTDGSTVFLAGQCTSDMGQLTYNSVWLNFTEIPTFTIQIPPAVTFTRCGSWDVAFLVCKPNAIIETREVRAQGSAQLIVQPLAEGKQFTAQGNASPMDTTTMLSFALSSITDIGPLDPSGLPSLGSKSQRDFLFGSQQVNTWPTFGSNGIEMVNVSFLPVANLSQGFAQMLQSASKGAF